MERSDMTTKMVMELNKKQKPRTTVEIMKLKIMNEQALHRISKVVAQQLVSPYQLMSTMLK
jgi:hypothetical protein